MCTPTAALRLFSEEKVAFYLIFNEKSVLGGKDGNLLNPSLL